MAGASLSLSTIHRSGAGPLAVSTPSSVRQVHVRRRPQQIPGPCRHEGRVQRLIGLPPARKRARWQAGGCHKALGIAGERVAQPGDEEPALPTAAGEHHQARLGAEAIERGLPAAPLPDGQERPRSDQQEQERGGGRPGPVRAGPRSAPVLRDQAGLQDRPRGLERRRVSGEGFQLRAELQVHRFERRLERGANLVRDVAAYHARQDGVRRLLDQHGQLADAQGVERVPLGRCERIANEVPDGGQHRRNLIGVLPVSGVRGEVLQQQPGLPVNQEHLLDPVLQRIEQHHFGERPAGPERRPSPPGGAPGHAVLHRAVERLHHRGERVHDGPADRGTHHREQGVRERSRVALDRGGQSRRDGGRQRTRELRIAGPHRHRVGQNAAHGPDLHGRVEQLRLQRQQLAPLGANNQCAQFVEAVGRRAAIQLAAPGALARDGHRISHSPRPPRRRREARRSGASPSRSAAPRAQNGPSCPCAAPALRA